VTGAPCLDLDIFSDGSLNEPWPSYRAIRDAGPAVRLTHELYDVYAVGRFADVRAVLRDWQHFSSAQGTGFNDMANTLSGGTVVGCDPPLHDQLRAIMLERLSVSEVRGLTLVVQKRADALVAELLEQGSFDGVRDLAERLVPAVLGDLLGISGDVLDSFAHAGKAVFDVMGIANARMEQSFPPLMALLEQLAALTKADMVEGSMGWDLYAAAERGEVPEEMTTALLLNYVGPGFETTINAIGSAVWLLARDPEQWKVLKHDASLVGSALNEVIRMEAPIQIWGRCCDEPVVVDGTTIPAGSRVAVLLGSANRDERHYPEPDHFDVTRNPADHVGFGHGIHLCLGAALARTEVQAVLTALVEQVATLECGEPVRRLNNTTRGLESLPVTVTG
jgi:cytochrome P450